MSEAHKVINLLRHAPKDDIVVMLMCMSLTVLFDMVIAISVGIVLASAVVYAPYRTHDSSGARSTSRCQTMLVLRVIGPLFFAPPPKACSTDLETRIAGKRIVVLKWDAVPVLDAGGTGCLPALCRTSCRKRCELRVSNLEFQPLRTLARAGVKPLPGACELLPRSLRPRWLACDPGGGSRACRIKDPVACCGRLSTAGVIRCPSSNAAPAPLPDETCCNVCGQVRRRRTESSSSHARALSPTPRSGATPPSARLMQLRHQRRPRREAGQNSAGG